MLSIKIKSIPHFLQNLFFGNFASEEKLRKSRILRILLAVNIFLAAVATVSNIIADFPNQDMFSELMPAFVLVFLYIIYILSKKVSSLLASFIIITLLSVIAYYLFFKWGTLLPDGWVLLALATIMGGILISSKFVVWLVLTHWVVLLTLTNLQSSGFLAYQWWDITPDSGSVIVATISITIIALVSWLSNREVEMALRRAWRSEAALKHQRDQLEVMVEKRTRQLKQAQFEKISQMYRFAEFGKLASGLFHDLSNPLTLVSMNLSALAKTSKRKKEVIRAKVLLARAISGTRHLENFLKAAKKQVQSQEILKNFDIKEEIEAAIQMLEHKATERQVKIKLIGKSAKTYGNPLKFNQIITNLISNAVDAYEKVKGENKLVEIKQEKAGRLMTISVTDWGMGINKRLMPRIFDSLFTTKPPEKGTGIGLSIAKNLVEKDFGGIISVKSQKGEGTVFTIAFPLRRRP